MSTKANDVPSGWLCKAHNCGKKSLVTDIFCGSCAKAYARMSRPKNSKPTKP